MEEGKAAGLDGLRRRRHRQAGALVQRRGWPMGAGTDRCFLDMSSCLTFFQPPDGPWGPALLESVWTIRDTRTFPLRVGLGQRRPAVGISGPCHSHTATPAPSLGPHTCSGMSHWSR